METDEICIYPIVPQLFGRLENNLILFLLFTPSSLFRFWFRIITWSHASNLFCELIYELIKWNEQR